MGSPTDQQRRLRELVHPVRTRRLPNAAETRTTLAPIPVAGVRVALRWKPGELWRFRWLERHSGDGIIFTSRKFDEFSILSGDLLLWHKRGQHDRLIEGRGRIEGTLVDMANGPDSAHTSKDV